MSDNSKKDYLEKQIDDMKSVVTTVADKLYNMDKNLLEHKLVIESQIETNKMMCSELKRMNNILEQNTESLAEHIRRTNLLEDAYHAFDHRLSPIELDIVRKKAVSAWVRKNLVLAAEIAGGIVACGAIYVAIARFLHL